MPGSRARPSISGSSVVPGLPNITETPSCRRIWRNAALPEMYVIAADHKASIAFAHARVFPVTESGLELTSAPDDRAATHTRTRRSHHDALPVESRVPALRRLRRRGIGADPGRPPE